MDKRRKKNDFIWLYVVDDGTEELKLRKEELLNRIEASKKSKNEVEVVEVKEVSDNNDF